VVNLAPDLAELITLSPDVNDWDDELCGEELLPLVELLGAMLSIASNLPQLAAELDGRAAPLPNVYLRPLPGGSSASGSADGGAGSSGGAAAAAAVEQAAAGASAILPAAGFSKLVERDMLRALAQLSMTGSPHVAHLTGLLTYNASATVVRDFCVAGVHQLQRELPSLPLAEPLDQQWLQSALFLTMLMLQPDSLLHARARMWAFGLWGHGQDGTREQRGGMLSVFGSAPLTWQMYHVCSLLHGVIVHMENCAPDMGHAYRVALLQLMVEDGVPVLTGLRNLVSHLQGPQFTPPTPAAVNAAANAAHVQQVLYDLWVAHHGGRQQQQQHHQQQQQQHYQQQHGGGSIDDYAEEEEEGGDGGAFEDAACPDGAAGYDVDVGDADADAAATDDVDDDDGGATEGGSASPS
jgi:hypothetical protein